MTEPKVKKKQTEPYSKGNATLIVELQSVDWLELSTAIESFTKASRGYVIEVHIGNEVFDA